MKKRAGTIAIVIGACACFVIATACVLCTQKQRIATLEGTIHLLKEETVPVKFRVMSRTEDTVSLRIKFYDADGGEIGEPLDLSMKGKELSFDFVVVKARSDSTGEERYLAFPYRVFTDMIAAADGNVLFDRYDSAGMPMVFASGDATVDLKRALVETFARVRKLDLAAEDFGSMVHDLSLKDISRPFLEGVTYKIAARAKGGIEVMEE